METSKLENKNVIIVCDDIYGLDVCSIINAINNNQTSSYHIIGVISDQKQPFGNIQSNLAILGTIQDWDPGSVNASYVMGIRNPKRKEFAANLLKKRGAKFETLIAPWVLLPSEFLVGEGCILANYNCKYMSKFGDFVTLDAVMCESVEIGDFSTLCPFVNITSAKIGKRVYVGAHSVIMADKKIEDDVYIYPGSIVVNNIKSGSIVAGIPASKIGAKRWL